MKLPVVAIVGRPNVGKSSLLNSLARQRVSIVESTPGVTRDRVSTVITHEDVTMEVIDTGGVGIVDEADLGAHIDRQIELAVRGANTILFVVDVREGVTPLDRTVANRLRPRAQEVPVILVANKVDEAKFEGDALEFYELGMGDPVLVSAEQGFGRTDLLDRVIESLGPTGEGESEPVMKLAVVGRRNVGKSTLVNALAREERVIVSEVPGTTRDSVDVRFEKDGHEFVMIDTAGVQRRSRLKSSIEFYSQVRTEQAIRRADAVLLLLDASEPVTRADKKLAQRVGERRAVCVVVANKWDLVRDRMSSEEFADYVKAELPVLKNAPVVFATAKDGRNIQSAVDLAQHLFKAASRRVTTGELNRFVAAIREYHRPRSRQGKMPKVYYATQVGSRPPTIVMFVNDPRLFSADYRRYMERGLQESLFGEEVPVRLLLRRRESIYHE